MTEEIVCDLSVCVDCLYAHANGDEPIDRPSDLPEPFSLIPFGYSVSMGGESLGFTWTSCDACGDSRDGDRFAMTLWRTTRETMIKRARDGVNAARADRLNGSRALAMVALDHAARWRRALSA